MSKLKIALRDHRDPSADLAGEPEGSDIFVEAHAAHGARWLSILILMATSGCGDGDPLPTAPSPMRATVRFEYRAATTTNAAVAAAAPGCVNGVGRTHIHPSWRNFSVITMTASGDQLWAISFTDVPTGTRQRIRISDPNACVDNPTGAVTSMNVFANGTLLTEIVDTPGSGTEPGFAFTVDAAGNITP